MWKILKRLFGKTPTVAEIVAPLARITAELDAAMVAHLKTLDKHKEIIAKLTDKSAELTLAHNQASNIKEKINNLIGN